MVESVILRSAELLTLPMAELVLRSAERVRFQELVDN
jgi:hypothetical protein